MLKNLEFVLYCLDEYCDSLKLTGKQAVEIFGEYDVYSFIEDSYDALHTFSPDNIVWNLQDYVEQRKDSQRGSCK